MDRKTWIAVALCLLFLVLYRPLLHWLGWDRYLAPPPPPRVTTVDSTRRDTTAARAAPGAPAPAGTQAEVSPGVPNLVPADTTSLFAAPVQPPEAELRRSFEIETPLYRATFSNRGARLVAVELKRYALAQGLKGAGRATGRARPGAEVAVGDRVVLASDPLLGLDLGSKSETRSLANVVYAASESLDAAGQTVGLTFTARDRSGAFIRQTYRVRPGTYVLEAEVEIRGVPPSWRLSDYSLTMRSWPLFTESDEIQDARALRATSMVGSNLRRDHAPSLVGKPRAFDGNAQWASVQSRYFVVAAAVSEGSSRGVASSATRRSLTPGEQQRLPSFGVRTQMEVASNTLVMSLPSDLKPVNHFIVYAGPGEYARLAALKVGLERLVDLGWVWLQPFSMALLWMLNWFFGVVRNYGMSIILLATVVRVLLHPLNMASMRSMRAMQRLQPEIERIREKYKNDAQAMNTAMMALYKENKVNPAGGCLPMLVQIPIFIALYQVLFNAIELRQAPFMGWIHDLSAPDLLFALAPFKVAGFTLGPLPVRLLPLLMTATGILSQRLTPSDPRQLPTMYMMNVVMLVFFYGLPSGLVLYWTLMNVLTAVQQWLVLQQDGGASAAVVVPAEATPSKGKSRRR
jgi:YidC/Oxa1 family membrane protein insertase